MPFFTISLCSGISVETKKEVIYRVTEITTNLLNAPPDKIQVITQELSKDNWGKSGAVLDDKHFSRDSRLVDWETKESYYSEQLKDENMILITIDVWDMYTQDQKNSWVEELTSYFVRNLHIPKDNILILIRDMPSGNWGQSGVTGANSNFLNESRLITLKK